MSSLAQMVRSGLITLACLACTSLAPPPLQFTTREGLRQAEVHFSSQGTQLAGLLLLPQSPPPYPGVVFIHGSGTSDRTNPFAAAISRQLALNGVAVLLPDKRGSGKSGGDWKTVGLEPLARDAVAAVRLLQQQPGVRRDSVGVLGFSQGGHIVPRAAALSDEVAFIVNVSGSVIPLIEQMFDEVEMMAEREGFNPGEIEEVNTIHRLAISYGRTLRGWDDYRSRLEAARSGPRGDTQTIRGFPDRPDHWVWQWGRGVAEDDPLPFWRKLKVPALIVYGDQDTQIRVAKSAELIRRHLGDRVELKIYPGAGHAIRERGTPVLREDFIRHLVGWITLTTEKSPPTSPPSSSPY